MTVISYHWHTLDTALAAAPLALRPNSEFIWYIELLVVWSHMSVRDGALSRHMSVRHGAVSWSHMSVRDGALSWRHAWRAIALGAGYGWRLDRPS